MNRYLTELIGTFFFVLTIGCTVVGNTGSQAAPVAIGSAFMVMVFAGRHVSGGHYNPAITLGVWLRGRLRIDDVLPYWLSQIIGSVLAALIVKYLKGGVDVAAFSPEVGPAILSELLFTFALVYVVLNVSTARGNFGNSFYGLAIGMTVMTGAYAVGGISGAAFNPAVAFGTSTLGLTAWQDVWIYLLADLSGGALAAYCFRYLNPKDP